MSYNLNLCSCFVFKSHFWFLDALSNVSWNKQNHCRSEKRPEACPPCTNTPTCCHDARGGDRQHRDVLGVVRRVEVCRIPSLGSSICLGPRSGDGEKSCLVMGCRGRREGRILLLLLFHLVQEHGILNLSGEWRVYHLWIWHWFNPLIWFCGNKKKLEVRNTNCQFDLKKKENTYCPCVVQSYLSWHSGDGRPEIWWIKMRIFHHFCNDTKTARIKHRGEIQTWQHTQLTGRRTKQVKMHKSTFTRKVISHGVQLDGHYGWYSLLCWCGGQYIAKTF